MAIRRHFEVAASAMAIDVALYKTLGSASVPASPA